MTFEIEALEAADDARMIRTHGDAEPLGRIRIADAVVASVARL